ncbi:MAG TPA: AmmeMemoRadiSam system protein A [bacterium]|nr:AmmeMemoRadiSam system protein A [bacterium]
MSGESPFLTELEQRQLLSVARDAVQAAVSDTICEIVEPLGNLARKCGVFVSLHRDEELRGCLGRFEPDDIPLLELVAIMAREAALNDGRFLPVSPGEIPELDIEISVLTPMSRVLDLDEIQVGRHGLYIIGKSPFGSQRHGTLLPQVGAEQGWDRQTFLEQTCRKAGLSIHAWKSPDTEIYTYEAEVFGEKALGLWPPCSGNS